MSFDHGYCRENSRYDKRVTSQQKRACNCDVEQKVEEEVDAERGGRSAAASVLIV